jgi:hypothetical protein
MTIQTINLGSYANDGTGDDLRTAFQKVNANFVTLNTTTIVGAESLGTGAPIYAGSVSAGSGSTLNFQSITAGPNLIIQWDGSTITLSAPNSIDSLQQDTNPHLGNNLNLNSHSINGTGNINITGSITATDFIGPLVGNVTGDVTSAGTSVFNNISASGTVIANEFSGILHGSVVGQISDLSNRKLADLGDVSNTTPIRGYALVWDGTQWAPSASGGGGGGSLDFGSFGTPGGIGLDFGSF